jgi:hypothetical protein
MIRFLWVKQMPLPTCSASLSPGWCWQSPSLSICLSAHWLLFHKTAPKWLWPVQLLASQYPGQKAQEVDKAPGSGFYDCTLQIEEQGVWLVLPPWEAMGLGLGYHIQTDSTPSRSGGPLDIQDTSVAEHVSFSQPFHLPPKLDTVYKIIQPSHIGPSLAQQMHSWQEPGGRQNLTPRAWAPIQTLLLIAFQTLGN